MSFYPSFETNPLSCTRGNSNLPSISIRSSRWYCGLHLCSFVGCCLEYCTFMHLALILGGWHHPSSLFPQHSFALLHYLCLEQAKPEHTAFLLGLFLQRRLYSIRPDCILAVGGFADHRAFDRHRHRPYFLLFQPGMRKDDEFEAVYNAAFLVSEGCCAWWIDGDCCRFQNRSCIERRKITRLEENGKERDTNWGRICNGVV